MCHHPNTCADGVLYPAANSLRKGTLATLCVVALLLLCAHPAYSQAKALVAVTGFPEDPTLSHVVGTAAEVQLQSEGLDASLLPVAQAGMTPGPSLIQAVRARGGDFVLLVQHEQRGGALALQMSFIRVEDGETLARRVEATTVSLNLDTDITRWVQSMTTEPAVQQAIQKATEARKVAEAKKAAEARKAAEAARAAQTTPRAERKPPAQPTPSEGSGRAAGRWGWTWTLDGSPMLLVGQAGEYFRYGADLSTFFGVRFPLANLSLESGAVAGATELYPAVTPAPGKVYAFRGGLGVRFGTSPQLPVGIFVHASAGAAAVMVHLDSGTTDVKTDFFAAGGIGASLTVFGSFMIGINLGAFYLMEEQYPIIAFTPSLEVRLSR